GLPVDLIQRNAFGNSSALTMTNRREGRNYEERRFIFQREGLAIIFPQQDIDGGEWAYTYPTLRINHERHLSARAARAELRWTIYADDMRRQEGQIPLFPDLLNY